VTLRTAWMEAEARAERAEAMHQEARAAVTAAAERFSKAGERWSTASGNEARVNIELAAAEAKRKHDEP
jgi:hypothetical protein